MKRIHTTLLLFISICLANLSAQSQNFWQDIDVSPAVARFGDPGVRPTHYRPVAIDLDRLAENLRFAPEERTGGQRPVLSFPLPNGETERFAIEHSPVMMPGLAARYHEIRSFRAISLDHKGKTGRFDYSPAGFHGTFDTPFGEIFIDPFEAAGRDVYVVYFTRDVEIDEAALQRMACGLEDPTDENPGLDEIRTTPLPNGHARGGSEFLEFHTYRLALTATGEYSQFHGNSIPNVLASLVTAVNRMNQTYENEAAINFVLIDDNDKLIWLDKDTDPFINGDEGIPLAGENPNAVNNIAGIPPSAYDIGHIFTAGCSDVGGYGPGRVCSDGKTVAVTCHNSPNVNLMIRRITNHEVGHQFSASHTFSNCGSSDQLTTGSAFEPGSGTTIMSYAGLCGGQNITFDNDDYFHVNSLDQIINYSRLGLGSTCGTEVLTGNQMPELTLSYPTGIYIPKSTPFELTASATDPDGDALTYCWEQFNLGPFSQLGSPTGDAPSFRSFEPVSVPNRIFPGIDLIVNNASDVREVLPTYGRALNFKCTVRDNNPAGGAAVWQEVGFRSTGTAGPFLVTTPNTPGIAWEGGTYAEVAWDVANTDGNLVNCQAVNIRLSTDGGYTYPYTLLTETPNDGMAMVPVPDIQTDSARVRIDGAHNIFFDISNSNFSISPAVAPGFTAQPATAYAKLCTPATQSFTIESTAYLGFEGLIQVEPAGELPSGISVDIDPAGFQAGGALPVQFHFDLSVPTGRYELPLVAFVQGVDTVTLNFRIDLISGDFTQLALQLPVDGTDGVVLSTDFEWIGSPNAVTYDFQLATSPVFTPASMVESATGLAETTYTPQGLFATNTLHYWRIRAVNECGPGAWTTPFTFHSQNVNCAPFQSQDIPKAISGSGLPTVESEMTINSQGIINDVNVSYFKANFQPVNSLRVTLISPAGTQVILYDKNCGNTVDLIIGFDDDAPNTITCPPDDNIVFRPVQPLSAFIGENVFGTWKMRVKVVTPGFGASGALEAWRLEFCSAGAAQPPLLVKNDTLYVPPGASNPITRNLLEAQDQDNDPSELTYTIVSLPTHGTLYVVNQPLEVGSQFHQSTVNAGNLYYAHNGDDARFDDFTFVVQDGTGGWVAPRKFNIKIDEDAVVSTGEPEIPEGLNLFPNPNDGRFTLEMSAPARQNWLLALRDMQGRQLWHGIFPEGARQTAVETGGLPDGIYLLSLLGERNGKVTTQKIMVSTAR